MTRFRGHAEAVKSGNLGTNDKIVCSGSALAIIFQDIKLSLYYSHPLIALELIRE